MSEQPCGDRYVEEAVEMLRSRSRRGIEKYGVTLERSDLDLEAWLTHLIEELADALNYAIRARDEVRKRRLGVAQPVFPTFPPPPPPPPNQTITKGG